MDKNMMGLLLGGLLLGAVAMRLSMQQGKHVGLPKHLAAAGAGVLVGAGAMHFTAK